MSTGRRVRSNDRGPTIRASMSPNWRHGISPDRPIDHALRFRRSRNPSPVPPFSALVILCGSMLMANVPADNRFPVMCMNPLAIQLLAIRANGGALQVEFFSG